MPPFDETQQESLFRTQDSTLPTDLYISMDVGTANIKSAYMIKYANEPPQLHLLQTSGNITNRIDEIIWDKPQAHSPTQIVFEKVTNGNLEELWGWSAEIALLSGRVEEEQMLRWLKVAIFNRDDEESEAFHQMKLDKRLRELSDKALIPNDMTARKLWESLLRQAYRYILRRICKDRPEIARFLPHAGSRKSDYGGRGRRHEIAIHVVFTVPANSCIESVQILLTTAFEAEIPCKYVVAEPVAAMVEVAQSEMEIRQSAQDYTPTAVVDTGAGTIDVVAVELCRGDKKCVNGTLREHWKIHELVPGATAWKGAAFVTAEFRKRFEALYDLDMAITQMEAKNPGISKEAVLDDLERQFETKKTEFNDDEFYYNPIELKFDGLPAASRPSFSINNGCVKLKFSFMVACFEPLVQATLRLLQDVCDKVEAKGRELGRIILTGGGNQNDYVRSIIVRHFENSRGYHINIQRLSNKASLRTVKGALMMLVDQEFLGERKVRRGYCFHYDPILVGSRDDFSDPGDSTWYDHASGAWRVHNRSCFILRISEAVSEGFKRRASEVLGSILCTDKYLAANTGGGFDINEEIYFTDDPEACQDGMDVDAEYEHGRLGTAGTLHVSLSDNDTNGMPVLLDFSDPPKPFLRIQYDFGISMKNGQLFFFILVPRSGKFSADDDLDNPRFDRIIFKKAELKSTRIFDEIVGRMGVNPAARHVPTSHQPLLA